MNRFEFKCAGRAVTARSLCGEVLFVGRSVGHGPEFKLDVREIFFDADNTRGSNECILNRRRLAGVSRGEGSAGWALMQQRR